MTLEQARQRRARSITLSMRSDALAAGFSERLAEMLESHRLKPSDPVQSPPFGSAAAALILVIKKTEVWAVVLRSVISGRPRRGV